MTGASNTETAQLARGSIGSVTKVTSAFRSMGKTSVRGSENCGRQHRINDRDALLFLRYVRKTEE